MKVTYFVIAIVLISCGTTKDINDTKVNTYPNSKYKKIRRTYSGTLNRTEYDELIKRLETELKTTFPTDKSILINYNKKAPNCSSARLSEKQNKIVTNNRIRISSRLSSNHNAIDFFVYAKDSYNREIYEQMTGFIIDSGFFSENVFTYHKNCGGFLIIKPNGKFYKRYGEDYYSEVEAILKRKKI